MESLTRLKSRKLEDDFKLYNRAGKRHYHALPSNLTMMSKFGVNLRVFGVNSETFVLRVPFCMGRKVSVVLLER